MEAKPERPTGRPRGSKTKTPPPPRLLRDMRLVYRQEKNLDVGAGQEALRKLLEEDPKGFLGQLSRLESEHLKRLVGARAASQEPPPGKATPAADAATGRLIEQIDRLLGEWGNEALADPNGGGGDSDVS